MGGERSERAGAALDALARYRREAGAAARCLIEGVRHLEEDAHGRRRAELVERAVREDGLDRAEAEQVYTVAEEEGLEPAFAFQLVRCGVGVRWPGEADGAATTLDAEVPPEWVAPVATPPADAARREWRLRASFRRLRRLLEERRTPEDALRAFVEEPDVDASGY
ncbi:MAG: hypothetical protein IRZ00_04050 [Gemmatimonadetes bacterium]|nr:hypothetical protein [Gemmatimonadota bacterium]